MAAPIMIGAAIFYWGRLLDRDRRSLSDLLMRVLALIFSAFLLTAASPPVPEVLRPYIKGDRFDPGDYKWIKGRFDGATAAEIDQAQQVRAWLKACRESDRMEMQSELRALQMTDARINRPVLRNVLCAQVANVANPAQWSSFESFRNSVEQARPFVDSYLLAVSAVKQARTATTPTFRDQLLARTLGERIMRMGFDWGVGAMASAPIVTPDVREIIITRLRAAIIAEDYENSKWLEQIIKERGWPKRSEVGEEASRQAWRIVHQAWPDPPFQVTILRAVKPLLASGEASRADYANLYDGILLATIGKQRYGTQVTCMSGQYVPETLEDPRSVDRLREEVGLEPLAKYLKDLPSSIGNCP